MTGLGELSTVVYVNMLSLGVIKCCTCLSSGVCKCLLFSAKQHQREETKTLETVEQSNTSRLMLSMGQGGQCTILMILR